MSVWDSLVASSEMSNRLCAVGMAYYPFMSSGISLIIFLMY